jgi:hypothetical protein
MTDRLNNGSVILPTDLGSAVLTFSTEGEEMVIGLHAPRLPYSEVRLGILLGCELRDRYLEYLTNAQLAAGVRARAEAVNTDTF